MNRIPSIHVDENQLALVLEDTLELDNYSKKDYAKLAKKLVSKLKTKTLINRSIIVSNDKLEKKTKKLLKSSRGDADLLANIIYNVRKKQRHRGIKQIKPNTRDWTSLKELTGLVVEFCNEFELQKREGFITYINIATTKLSSHSNYLNKLINMYEGICKYYEAKLELDKDPTPNITEAIHNMYCIQIVTRTGLPADYKNQPEKYVHFLTLKRLAKEVGVSFEQFLKAQFHAFEWRSGVPDPVQLIGNQWKERLNKYLFEKNIKVGKTHTDTEKANKLKSMREKYN